METMAKYEKEPGVPLTEALLKQFTEDSDETRVLRRLIDLVKICDVNAYQQDHSKPVVARSFIRQNAYYKSILQWKLEPRKGNPMGIL